MSQPRRLSLRVVLVVVFTAVVVGASAGTSALWYRHSQSALTQLGNQLRSQILERTQDTLTAHLGAPRQANHILRTALEHGMDPTDPGPTAEQLLDILETLDPDYVAVGFAEGGLVGAEHLATGEPRVAFTEDMHAGTLTTYAVSDAGIGAALSGVAYDARSRPWFEAAVQHDASTWSPVYLIATPPARLGITLAEPVRAPDGTLTHVIASDVIVSNFSSFLAGLDLGVEGTVVVVDPDGYLVASSSGEPMLQMQAGEAVRTRGTDSQDPAVAALTARLLQSPVQGEQRMDLAAAGQRYLIEVAPVHDPGLDWVVAVILPEAAVLGAVQRSTRDTVILSALGLLVALGLGVIIQRRITRPLELVTANLQDVARFQLEPAKPSGTPIREVAAIEDATERMKRGLRSFERYVSSDLVRSLIRQNREATLGVEPVELSVFFSDIEGFATLAEELPPDQLVEVVGAYLGEWSNLILFSGGTVDKFIGDAIMAFWNAPEQVEDHPAVACDVALRCQARLGELNTDWEARGLPRVRSRIGLHTDTVLVGNLGSAQRMDYTVVGDGVNLASRLEGLNKVYGTDILISEEVRLRVADRFLTRPLDLVRVKGRQQITTVHELLATRQGATPEQRALAKAADSAFEAYLEQDFEVAAARFEAIADVAAGVLAERCRRLAVHGPGEDWDGAEV